MSIRIYTGNLEYNSLIPIPERWIKAADYEADREQRIKNWATTVAQRDERIRELEAALAHWDADPTTIQTVARLQARVAELEVEVNRLRSKQDPYT